MDGEEIVRDVRGRYVTGLDLGQSKDYTALAVLERSPSPGKEENAAHYSVCHLERPQLGTPYPAIVERVGKMFAAPPLAGTMLAVDQTGVGRAVVDLFDASAIDAQLRPVTITAGHATTPGDGCGWHVPKKELVGTLQLLLQGRRLHVARHLLESQTLIDELLLFQVKVTAAANETFGTWREGRHDDLVLAVAMAAWAGENLGIRKLRIWR